MKAMLILSLVLNLVLVSGLGFFAAGKGGWSYLKSKFYATFVHDPYAVPQATATFAETLYYKRLVSLHELTPVRAGDIVFLGDSQTEPMAWADLFENPRVRNRGIGGDDTEGVLKRLDPIARANPAQIYLLVGCNDLFMRGMAPHQVAASYETIIDRIRLLSPQTKLFILSSTLAPINHVGYEAENERILEMNRLLQALAEEKAVTYIDLIPALNDTRGALAMKYTYDGGHLNGAAYAVIRDLLLPYVNAGLKATPDA